MIEARDMHKYLRSGSEEYYTQEIAEKLLRSSMSLPDKEFRLLLDECPVVNPYEIVMHYTSTTYKEWCEA